MTESMAGEQFGKFAVLDVLGRGGMAEALRCRLSGIGGFDKLVVVKRILPNLSTDPEFVNMFLDEARLAANFTHPHVVQVFEIDEANGIPYIAMEYVHGLTFARMMRAAYRSKNASIGHAAHVIADIATGLHYVHSAKGPDGEPLNFVHRDVSPANIIVSLDGVAKLLDFGIAKAEGRMANTQSGVLKGKLRYMSPEQARGATLDARADVFSLGVCLYEATTFRSPLGKGQLTEVAMLHALLTGNYIKPSEVVPDYPPELERIVMWAIAPRIEDRCPSAEELHTNLEKFCASTPGASSRKELSQWITKLAAYEAQNPSKPRSTVSNVPRATPVRGSSVRMVDSIRTISHQTITDAGLGAPDMVTTSRTRMRLLTSLSAGGVVAVVALLYLLSRPSRSDPLDPRQPVAPSQPALFDPPPQDDDRSAEAYLAEADRYVRAQKLAPAEELLKKAKQLKLKDPKLELRLTALSDNIARDTSILKGKGLLRNGDIAGAIEAAQAALDRDPTSEEAKTLVASAREREKSVATAPVNVTPTRNNRGGGGAHPKSTAKEGGLVVSSTPPAPLYVDGETMGQTPVDLHIAAGSHRLQVRLKGYLPVETETVVVAGRDGSVTIPLAEDPRSKDRPVDQAKKPNVIIIDEPKTKVHVLDDDAPKVRALQ